MSQNAPNGGNAVNLKTGKKPLKSRSTYDLSYRMACTPRYAFITPFFKFEGVPGDRVSLRSGHNLRTLSLKSPLFQNLRMNKDFYAVPMKALLPLNWDKLFNNPVQGEDINPLAMNTLIGSYDSATYYGSFMYKVFKKMQNYAFNWNTLGAESITVFSHILMTMNNFFGKGNLFEAFRIDPTFGMDTYLGVSLRHATDVMFNAWHAYLINLGEQLGDIPYLVEFKDDAGETIYDKTYDLRNLTERMRFFYDVCDNPLFTPTTYSFEGFSYANAAAAAHAILAELKEPNFEGDQYLYNYLSQCMSKVQAVPHRSVNIAPVLAYQMICAEYFTNDKIDLCYNSDMWRQVIFTYGVQKMLNGIAIPQQYSTFEWNGKDYTYDAFSAISLENLAGSSCDTKGQTWVWFALMNQLFGYQRGLKYIDYFTGSRTRPIAVGDLNVSVLDNKVDVIDVTKKIQWQRFLNQVNRIGPDAKNYLKGIFDVEERQHIDVPVKIGHIDETVYGEEVQNTADAQQTQPNSITTNLKSRGSNYAFEFNVAESTIVIGVVTFSIRRFYNNGVDPFSLKKDRFDMFNPYMQFVGDQPIYVSEIAKRCDPDDIFGYTGRYAEYKNSVDYAIGDFKDGTLKSWIFSDSTPEFQSGDDNKHVHVSPEFIRQQPTELDDYYLNMTGSTPGDRYHFICVFDNIVEAKRDMVWNPQILG